MSHERAVSSRPKGRPLSVVMVSAGFWPAVGGAERQALEQSAALAARGHRVTVLTRRVGGLPRRETHRGVDIVRLPVVGTGALDSLCFLFGAFAWLLLHWTEWDATHAHLAGSPALAAALAGRMIGRPAVVKLGGGRGIGELAASSKTAFGRAKLRALGLIGPHFLAVVADLADEAREFLGDADIEVLPNGVDDARFRPLDAAGRRAARARLGWPEGAPVYLYPGRFSPEKRLTWFLKLWQASAGADALAVLVGDGPDRAALEGLAAGAFSRVRVLPPSEDLAESYAAADAFFLPSTSEGLSNSLLEAMASGCAPLASRVGGTAETVESDVTGLLFERDDEEGLKRAVARLSADRGLAARLGAEARKRVEERYSLARVVDRLEELYRG
ncbi:MAG: glycosyltransferase family 4 protein [Elusimicrobia bacterium]|nr:glycosyltransferase family 4 protein [Elusimicrobiota bacterium]